MPLLDDSPAVQNGGLSSALSKAPKVRKDRRDSIKSIISALQTSSVTQLFYFGIFPIGIENKHMAEQNRYSRLRDALIEARHTQGLTQAELASRLSKSQSFVSKYESGERRLDVVEFLDVCEALSVKPLTILRKMGSGDA